MTYQLTNASGGGALALDKIQSERMTMSSGFDLVRVPGTASQNQIGMQLEGNTREFQISGVYTNASGVSALKTFASALQAFVSSSVATEATAQYYSDLFLGGDGSTAYVKGVVRDLDISWMAGDVTLLRYQFTFVETS